MMLAFQLWILVQHVQNMFKFISAFALAAALFRYFSATFPYFSATAAYPVDRLQTQAGDKWPELLVSWAPIFRKKRCKKRTKSETMQKSHDVSQDGHHTMFRRDLCKILQLLSCRMTSNDFECRKPGRYLSLDGPRGLCKQQLRWKGGLGLLRLSMS